MPVRMSLSPLCLFWVALWSSGTSAAAHHHHHLVHSFSLPWTKKGCRMHLVSDLQRRPNKGRLKCEKRIVPFYDLCTLVQLTAMVVHTVLVSIASNRTFVHTIWWSNPLVLVKHLESRMETCEFTTQRDSLYAFYNVNVVLNAANVNDIFADHALQMRLTVFLGMSVLLCGIVNRLAVEINFFQFTWRNFVLRKDIISALELGLLCCLLRTTLMVKVAGDLLAEYLHHCDVVLNVYLPLCSTVPLFVFMGVGCSVYAVGTILYLWNALPKYGIMTEEEIVDYKEWLRNKRARIDEAKRIAMEARREKLRLHFMMRSDHVPQPRDIAYMPSAASSLRRNIPAHLDAPITSVPNLSSLHASQSVNMPRRRDASVVRQQQPHHHQQQEGGGEPPVASMPFYASMTGASVTHSA